MNAKARVYKPRKGMKGRQEGGGKVVRGRGLLGNNIDAVVFLHYYRVDQCVQSIEPIVVICVIIYTRTFISLRVLTQNVKYAVLEIVIYRVTHKL